jgi:hypothetical protein
MDNGRGTGADALPVELDGRDFRGDLNIRIDAAGTWHYNHSPIERKEMVCLFASMLAKDTQGRYWLVTPTELGRIDVEDAPLLAVDLYVTGRGQAQIVHLATNVDQIITVTSQTPIIMKASPANGAMTPYIINEDGIEAKLTRAVYYSLVEVGAVQENSLDGLFGVWSSGSFFPLGAIFDTDA